jgi:acyl carrier protein
MNPLNIVIEATAEVLCLDRSQIHSDAPFEELGADSLDLVRIISRIEDKTSLALPDEEAEMIQTPLHLSHLVERIQREQISAPMRQ